MLELILGVRSQDKLAELSKRLSDCLSSGERVLLIVPEQFSFETEKQLLQQISPELLRELTILDFTSLSGWIFQQVGGLSGSYVTPESKKLILHLAMREITDLLRHYAGAVKPSAVPVMLDRMEKLKLHLLSPAKLLDLSAKLPDGTLSQKLRELALIRESFDTLMAEQYLDPSDALVRCIHAAQGAGLFSGYHVFMDEFTSFTAPQMEIIRIMTEEANAASVLLCLDKLSDQVPDYSLLAPINQTALALIETAKKVGTAYQTMPFVTEKERFGPSILVQMEHFLRLPEQSVAEMPIGFQQDALHLVEAPDRESEIRFVASQIVRLAREGFHYSEISVVGQEIETYQNTVETIFRQYNIPVFFDFNRSISSNSVMNCPLFALAVLTSGFESEQLLGYLKTHLTPLSFEEISDFESYIYLWNINYSDFKKPFVLHPDGFSPEFTEKQQEQLAHLEELRRSIVTPLEKLSAELKRAKDGGEMIKALYRHIETIGMPQRVLEEASELEAMNFSDGAVENRRLYEKLTELLEQMYRILKNRTVSIQEFYEIFKMMISGCTAGVVPKRLDCVSVGGAGRMRMGKVKAVFVVGAAQGIFPRTPKPDGFFSRQEQKLLRELGQTIGTSLEEQALEERLTAYLYLTAASDCLYVTYSRQDAMGQPLTPSPLFEELVKLPGVFLEPYISLDPLDFCLTEEAVLDLYCEQLTRTDELTASLREYLLSGKYRDLILRLDKGILKAPEKIKSPQARKLLSQGRATVLSATKLETLSNCKFSYFCKYIARAKPLDRAELRPLESGGAIHAVLSEMLEKYSPAELTGLEKGFLREELSLLLSRYCTEQMGADSFDNPRFRFLFSQLAKGLERVILRLADELCHCKFLPVDFELSVKEGGEVTPLALTTPLGNQISIEGTIDRIDLYKNENGKKYVRVIDYKSGEKKFSLSQVYYGLNMQMLLYLFSVSRNGRGKYEDCIPAGILYMPAGSPKSTLGRYASQEEEQKYLRDFYRMNGLLLDNRAVLKAMEEELQGNYIPVALTGKGELTSSSLASLTQLGGLYEYLYSLIGNLFDSVAEGDISAKPLKGKDTDACRYCDFQTVCGFEEGDMSREITSLSDKAFFEELARQGFVEDGEGGQSHGS